MISLCEKIYNWVWPNPKPLKKKSDIEISNEAKIMLNEWQVSMYANNRYLQKIPAKLLNDKYHEFIIKIRTNEPN